MTPPWLPDDDRTYPTHEPEPVRTGQAPGPTCTAAERAYLDAILSDNNQDRRNIPELRARIAAERLGESKRKAIVRAWADMILARRKWDKLMDGLDLGGPGVPLYEVLSKEADELAEREGTK